MIFEIKKIISNDTELLPDIIDTPLWEAINPDRSTHSKKSVRQLAALYQAISKRENYYQENTPTAFGNPEYSYYRGVVIGLLQAIEAYEKVDNQQIVIRSEQNNKKILVIDKLNRPRSYYIAVKDNSETLRSLGL